MYGLALTGTHLGHMAGCPNLMSEPHKCWGFTKDSHMHTLKTSI